jgi:hypothetical protein
MDVDRFCHHRFFVAGFFAEWKKARFDKRNVTEFQPLAVKGANFIKV